MDRVRVIRVTVRVRFKVAKTKGCKDEIVKSDVSCDCLVIDF